MSALAQVRAHRAELDRLDALRDQEAAARNEAIREAHRAGETVAELTRASGLTRTMVYKIIEKGHATG